MIAVTKKYKQILIHFLIWISFLAIFSTQIYLQRGEITNRFIILMIVNFIFFYVNYLFLVPQILLKKKTLLYFFFAIIIIASPIYIVPLFYPNDINIRVFSTDGNLVRTIEYSVPIIFNLSLLIIGTSIRVYQEWDNNEKKKTEIESQRIASELEYLKTQLNPHFLFNSLNSIYSLTVKKSNDAPEAVVTLSELMRYMLYQTNSEFVLLKNELEYIKNYMSLQRLRIANNKNVAINIHGAITTQKIKPLLLISFIENAFKYGTDFKGNTEVKIKISIQENELHFTCVNLIGNKNAKNEDNSGIGLQNTKNRLELLYPNNHTLSVKEENNKFVIDLTLKLD